MYNIASLDSTGNSPYIPGLTAEQRRWRMKIIQWGGLACILVAEKKSQTKVVREFCENAAVREQIRGRDLRAVIDSINLQMNSVAEEDKGKAPIAITVEGEAGTQEESETMYPEYPTDRNTSVER